jgi:hypothetical protein
MNPARMICEAVNSPAEHVFFLQTKKINYVRRGHSLTERKVRSSDQNIPQASQLTQILTKPSRRRKTILT